MQATWILPDGQKITTTVPEARSLMEAALANNVRGVVGECGGNLSCATCHVHVAPEWLALTGVVGSLEDAMLDVAAGERLPNSRLSCQIEMTEILDGITLVVPQP